MRYRAASFLIRFFALCAAIALAALFISITAGLLYCAWRAGAGALKAFGPIWNPANGLYGILPMVAGSFITAFMAVGLAFPLSCGILAFIWVYDNRLSHLLRDLLRFMSGIPTVVYGFFGLFLLIPFLRALSGTSGYGVFAVSLILALLVLPVMTITADSALSSALKGSENPMLTASALGLRREQAFLYIVLATQKKALLMGLLLAFSRALGDTLVALMLAGNAPVFPSGLFSSVRTLSGHISLLTATEITPQTEFTLFLSGFILFSAAFVISLITAKIQRRKNESS